MKPKVLLSFIFFVFIIGLPLIYYLFDSSHIFLNFLNNSNQLIETYLNKNYFFSFLIIFLLLFTSVVINIPGNSLKAIFVGFYFEIIVGSLIITLSITFGSYVFYYLLNKKIISSVGFKKSNYELFLKRYLKDEYSWFYLIGLRLTPIIPLPIQNIIISAIEVPKKKFLITTLIGISPLLIIYVLIGSQLSSIIGARDLDFNSIIMPNLILLLCLVFIAISISLIMSILEKKYFNKNSKNASNVN